MGRTSKLNLSLCSALSALMLAACTSVFQNLSDSMGTPVPIYDEGYSFATSAISEKRSAARLRLLGLYLRRR